MRTDTVDHKVLIRCRAEITFANGMKRTVAGDWSDQRYSFDQGNWGLFPNHRGTVEDEVRKLQGQYGAPAASVAYFRDEKTLITQVIETQKSSLHCTREVTA